SLLDVSRINAHNMDLHFEELDLAEVLRESVETYAVEAAFHLVDIHLAVPNSLRGRWDRLEVADHGIGISTEDQARIFGRFAQVVTGQHRTGFGVGLWLARALIEA